MTDLNPLGPWEPSWLDARDERLGYDLIGDVHGCGDELEQLMTELGYTVHWTQTGDVLSADIRAPQGRKLVLLGDLVDRGPRSADVLRIALGLARAQSGYTVLGNHDHMLLRNIAALQHAVAAPYQAASAIKYSRRLESLGREPLPFLAEIAAFLTQQPSYIWLADGELAAAHTGLTENMLGDASLATHIFAIYGQQDMIPADTPDHGLEHWTNGYHGRTVIAYGHFRLCEAIWAGNTICLDTSCVYGGKLSALRWPERTIVTVPAAGQFAESVSRHRVLPMGTSPYYTKSAA